MRRNSPRDTRQVPQFDSLDQQLIAYLQQDGRQSNRALAKQLDVPEATVRYRLRRLLDRNLVRITAVVNRARPDCAVTALICLQVEMDRGCPVAEQIQRFPEVSWVAIVTGSQDIILRVTMPDQAALGTFVTQCLGTIPGVRHMETMLALRVLEDQPESLCQSGSMNLPSMSSATTMRPARINAPRLNVVSLHADR